MSNSQQLFQENQLARHLGSGSLYKVLQPNVLLESDQTPMVVYRSQYDGVIWTRPLHEFMIKFEPLKGSGTST